MIDYNFMCFQQAIQEVFDVKTTDTSKLAISTSGDYSHTNGSVNWKRIQTGFPEIHKNEM